MILRILKKIVSTSLVGEARWATDDPVSVVNVAASKTVLPTLYLRVYAAFKGVSAPIRALTPSESGRKDEEEIKCYVSDNPFIRGLEVCGLFCCISNTVIKLN